ncbi:MAG TPA: aryl-sulfate sulfotransferase [Caulobacteraceae bacterium]|nr:aryl-sulfate sulfotransferase [Caulobacteraceae bacterium]
MGWSVNRPTGLTFHRSGLSTKGYTLLTPHGDASTYLIDLEGRIVHRWTFTHIKPGYGRLLDNGHLLMTGSDVNLPKPPPDEPTKPPPPLAQHVTRLGGYHTTLCEVDWDGNVVWEYVNPFQHHDFHRFANGNTMVPEWVEVSEDLHKSVRGGFSRPRERLPRLLGDDLVEVTPDKKEVRRIQTWKLLDPKKDRIEPRAIRWEWTHINGIDVNEKGDIVFSARNCDRVCVISGETGEISFKFDKVHGQHNPTWLPNGNILVFDNGHDSSKLVEIDPAKNEIVWTFRGRPSQQFFSGHISGASRLSSGNVLVCEGTSGRLFEVTRAGEVAWEWINPFVNNNSRGDPTVSIYRAHRYDPDHPALAGRDLDPDRFGNLNRLNGLA